MNFKEAFFILQHGSSEGEHKYLESVQVVREYVKCLENKNREFKRLLKLAIEDIDNCSFCSMCANHNDESKCRKCKVITLDMFKWKHGDEAEKLLKMDGEKNNGD